MMLKEFKIGDIFEKIETVKLPYKAADYKDWSLKDGIPATTSGVANQGLTAYVPRKRATVLKNCISIASNGDAGATFYQSEEFTILQDSYAVKYKDDVNATPKAEHYLYAVATFMKSVKPLYSYVNKAVWNKVKNNKILFPVKNVIFPDYDLIENLIGGGIDMSKIDASIWKEFSLDELFDVTTTKSQNKNAITFDNNGPYDFIGRSSVNYGIQGHLNKQEYDPNPANVFSLVQVGESVCLYRENEWYASQNIFMLKPKDNRICTSHNFFETLIDKQLSIYKNAYEYPCLEDIKEMKILLPYKETEEIDFEYMENYISELEAERISELEAFLAVTGLDDYELTEEDIEVLNRYRIEVEVVA